MVLMSVLGQQILGANPDGYLTNIMLSGTYNLQNEENIMTSMGIL